MDKREISGEARFGWEGANCALVRRKITQFESDLQLAEAEQEPATIAIDKLKR